MALQINFPSHSASAIVRAKAPTIMAHINRINDTALNAFRTTHRNRSHRHSIRSGHYAFYAVHC